MAEKKDSGSARTTDVPARQKASLEEAKQPDEATREQEEARDQAANEKREQERQRLSTPLRDIIEPADAEEWPLPAPDGPAGDDPGSREMARASALEDSDPVSYPDWPEGGRFDAGTILRSLRVRDLIEGPYLTRLSSSQLRAMLSEVEGMGMPTVVSRIQALIVGREEFLAARRARAGERRAHDMMVSELTDGGGRR